MLKNTYSPDLKNEKDSAFHLFIVLYSLQKAYPFQDIMYAIKKNSLRHQHIILKKVVLFAYENWDIIEICIYLPGRQDTRHPVLYNLKAPILASWILKKDYNS